MNPSLTRKAGRPVPPDKGSFPLDHEGKSKITQIYVLYSIVLVHLKVNAKNT